MTDIDHKDILESIPAASWVYSVEEANYVHLSDRIEELFGYPLSSWRQGPGFSMGIVHPDDADRVMRLSQEAMTELGSTSYAWRARCADGDYRWIESRISCEESDEGVFIYGVFLEVRGFPESQVDLFDLVNQSTDGMLLISSSYTVDAVNPSLLETLGYDEGHLLGRNVLDIESLSVDAPEPMARALRATLESTEVEPTEIEFETAAGKTATFEMNPSLVLSRKGEPRVMLSLRDISARKASEELERRLEARVTQSQRLESIGRLAGGIAHDFNNLLTVMMSNVDLMLERTDLPKSVRRDLESVGDAARRSADLTGQLMAFGRKQMLSPRTIDTNTALLKIVRIMSRVIDESVEVEYELDNKTWPLHVDPTQFEQVLVNLLVNAQDALPAGGTITIRSENRRPPGVDEGEWVCVSVKDDGLGIAPEDVDQIFEPFFTTKPPGLGTGLGLATVHGVVKQSGGHLEVDTALGRGTNMQVFLPRSYETPEISEVDGVKHRNGKPCQVLIVEDQPLVRRAASRILSAEGYKVHQAENVDEAREILDSHEIGAVVCDLNLKGESGWEVRDYVEEVALEPAFVFMSGDPASMVDDLEGERFLQKPFSRESIVDMVNEAVEAMALD